MLHQILAHKHKESIWTSQEYQGWRCETEIYKKPRIKGWLLSISSYSNAAAELIIALGALPLIPKTRANRKCMKDKHKANLAFYIWLNMHVSYYNHVSETCTQFVVLLVIWKSLYIIEYRRQQIACHCPYKHNRKHWFTYQCSYECKDTQYLNMILLNLPKTTS